MSEFYRNFTKKIKPSSKHQNTLHSTSQSFWKSKDPSINSMCGLEDLHDEDTQHTKQLLNKYLVGVGDERALDIGAGIGRITFSSLYPRFRRIDMLDSNSAFLESAKMFEKSTGNSKIENFYASTIEEFRFKHKYDLVFVQWVLEYVSHEDLLKFFTRVKLNLQKNGVVIIKENVNILSDEDIIVSEEGSTIRPPDSYENIFKTLGYSVEHDEIIPFHRTDIYEVKCWILKI